MCCPAEREGEELLATPEFSTTGAPKFTPSIWNCTLPVGVPAPGETVATVAEKLTGWPSPTNAGDVTVTLDDA